MIEDLGAGESKAAIAADVCVVGAGPAGITLALDLARSGISVCLLESGGFEEEADTQALSQGEVAGYHVWIDEGRPRVLGGATSIWGGRLARLDPEDFKPRPWANSAGWPYPAEVLEPYYDRAAKVCGVEEPWEDDQVLLRKLQPEKPWDWRGGVKPFVWRYANSGFRCYLHWGEAFLGELKALPNLRLILHANVTSFHADKDGQVETVTAQSLKGGKTRVTAGAFVLASGGIENARLLLASAETIANGGVHAGNDHVGRYFMQHPRGIAASIGGDQALGFALQDIFNVFTRRRPPQYEVGFALKQSVQEQEGLLNCSAVLDYEADPGSAWEVMKDRARRLLGRAPGAKTAGRGVSAFDLWSVMVNIWRRGVQGRHVLQGLSRIRVMVDVEQRQDGQSRVTLADARDALGMRKARVDWRMSEHERLSVRRFIELLGEEFERLGAGKVIPEPWLNEDGPIPDWAMFDNIHHMGATRMAKSAKDGVVDEHLKVHGSDRVYVTGSSVFPSGGHANPTLTVLALSLKLADHLKARLRPA